MRALQGLHMGVAVAMLLLLLLVMVAKGVPMVMEAAPVGAAPGDTP